MSESKPTEEIVTVTIEASCRVKWKRDVEMTRNEWEALKAVPEHKMEAQDRSPLCEHIDFSDPDDWQDFDDVELYITDDNHRVVDEYTGGEE